jgi:hypothetical protein
MINNDKNKRSESEKGVKKEEPKQKPQEKKQDKNNEEKDPHRGTTDTPRQDKDMIPGSQDPDSGYIDDDGALDEELEDMEDEEE